MRIMSWNVNQFCGKDGTWREYDKDRKKNENYVKPDDRIPFMDNVIWFVKGFLYGNEDNVVILQEVPGKSVKSLYGAFKAAFSEESYKIIPPKNIAACETTVAITNKKSNWEEKKDFFNFSKNGSYKNKLFFENKYIELYHSKKEITLLGVHMPIGHTKKEKEGKEEIIKKKLDKDFWNALTEYVQGKPKENKNFIIIGDFNAFEEKDGSCVYQGEYQRIIAAGYKDAVSGITFKKGTTKRKDDHILKTASVPTTNGEVLSNIELSDHYPIVAEIPDRKENADE